LEREAKSKNKCRGNWKEGVHFQSPKFRGQPGSFGQIDHTILTFSTPTTCQGP